MRADAATTTAQETTVGRARTVCGWPSSSLLRSGWHPGRWTPRHSGTELSVVDDSVVVAACATVVIIVLACFSIQSW